MYRKLEPERDRSLNSGIDQPVADNEPCPCTCKKASADRGDRAPVGDYTTNNLRVDFDING